MKTIEGTNWTGKCWICCKNTKMKQTCPLCLYTFVNQYAADKNRSFVQCRRCRLVFVPWVHHVTPAAEKAQYDLHQNSPNDPAYRRFLSRLFRPMIARLGPGAAGLEFGSGPGPTLSVMFEEAGYHMQIYDPYFADQPGVFKKKYDFITASEVVEHLREPGRDLDKLWHCLKPGGWLGILTQMVKNPSAFKTWRYIDDPTHICFFSIATFKWQAQRWGVPVYFTGKDVVLFRKKTYFSAGAVSGQD